MEAVSISVLVRHVVSSGLCWIETRPFGVSMRLWVYTVRRGLSKDYWGGGQSTTSSPFVGRNRCDSGRKAREIGRRCFSSIF